MGCSEVKMVLSSEISEAFVKDLDANLKEVRSKSRLYQEKLAAEHVATPVTNQRFSHKNEAYDFAPAEPIP